MAKLGIIHHPVSHPQLNDNTTLDTGITYPLHPLKMCIRDRGTTENAVRIQISVAIITYCLVAIVQHDMKLKRSTYEVLQILSISLTDKTHLRDLFDKTNFNDVKDLNDPLIPGLFD